jgi:sulfite dehydrogenase
MDSARTTRRTLAAVISTIVVLSVVIVALVAHEADTRTVDGKDLTSTERHGAALFATTCQGCHALKASNAVGRVGPSLDYVQPTARQVEQVIASGSPGAYGAMPAGLLTGADAAAVAAYVEKVAARRNVN